MTYFHKIFFKIFKNNFANAIELPLTCCTTSEQNFSDVQKTTMQTWCFIQHRTFSEWSTLHQTMYKLLQHVLLLNKPSIWI